ncbi:hypothetical protein FHS01_005764, partial [Longimicrobium terrae]|nr:hypothetical protein [Longimicrobium terrae]MBB4639686.1 hypothetical protein [Longimicrobium terrae]MBB6074067.1 hypothetical protein [Longimicrobium terrae]MBB6074082.1 hypothetical protein [Longimicrobium terrae]
KQSRYPVRRRSEPSEKIDPRVVEVLR